MSKYVRDKQPDDVLLKKNQNTHRCKFRVINRVNFMILLSSNVLINRVNFMILLSSNVLIPNYTLEYYVVCFPPRLSRLSFPIGFGKVFSVGEKSTCKQFCA